MSRPDRPQLRFLARVSVLFAVALAVWWVALREPLLNWVQLSTAVLLDAAGGFRTDTGVSRTSSEVWTIRAPVPAPSEAARKMGTSVQLRSLRLQLAAWIPTLQTVSLPLYWAILLAAPHPRWKPLALGSLVLLLLPPVSLLVYSAHVVQRNVFPDSSQALAAFLNFADYVCGTVFPYLAPVAIALILNTELREMVLGGSVPSDPEIRPGRPFPRLSRR